MLILTISKLRLIAKGRNMFKKQSEDLFNLFTKPQGSKIPKKLTLLQGPITTPITRKA